MAGAKQSYDAYDDEADFDDEYFLRTYQPLSNLPTPPPSCRDSIVSLSTKSINEQDELLESALLGPAVHLVNLIPAKASLATPSIPTVHEILTRAGLPSETVALAVCILDSLNSKFSQHWRQSCPTAPAPQQSAGQGAVSHIDAVRPELIVLASLIVAAKFLEDYQDPTHHYAANWGAGLWTCEQINVTERCIMESLGYRIMPLWDPTLIRDAQIDMERAGSRENLERQRFGSVASSTTTRSSLLPAAGPMSARARKSFFAPGCFAGHPLTPAETPQFERVVWWAVADDGCAAGGAPQAATTGGGPAPGRGLDPLLTPPRRELSGFPFPSSSAAPLAEGEL